MKFIVFALLVTLACVSAIPAGEEGQAECKVSQELKDALDKLVAADSEYSEKINFLHVQ